MPASKAKIDSLYSEDLHLDHPYSTIIGRSLTTQRFLKQVDQVTAVKVPVLLLGESGVGKELVARAIHENGSLSAGPFVAANCSSIPETLVESEFFGHERGAFTGATESRPGLFEQADGGTLFLDEIGEMPVTMQAKLLRVLQDSEVRRVGSSQIRHVELRILAATNRNLKSHISTQQFREDLFYRLSVAEITIPPLRERKADIPLLVDYFLAKFAKLNQLPAKKLNPQGLPFLLEYNWPGNIRELENFIYHLCTFVLEPEIPIEALQEKLQSNQNKGQEKTRTETQLSQAIDSKRINLSQAKRQFEREQILRVLKLYNFRVGKSAEHLGILRPQLSRLIKYHGIKKDRESALTTLKEHP